MQQTKLPQLLYADWKDTLTTLHLIFQIIGKARLKLTTRKNHWWYVTLYVTSKGFGTHTIPIDEGFSSIEIDIDMQRKAVVISHSDGTEKVIALTKEPTIAEFYQTFMQHLHDFGLHPNFIERPIDLVTNKPFDQITEYHHYDWTSIEKFWRMMHWNHSVFQEFSGRFYGKSCPVHIYWHHLDLTVTRFSGKKLPPVDKSSRILERDTYTHEQISFGFWAGDPNTPEPMYYSYTYPSPEGLAQKQLSPEAANWQDSNGSPMALLSYEAVRQLNDSRAAVLDFLESAYQAGANLAGWKLKELTVPSLEEI